MSSFNPGKPTIAEFMARQFWRSFRDDGGLLVSSERPSPASASASGLSAGLSSLLPGAGVIQLERIAEEPRLKLSLLRHKNTWASNDNDDDDRNRDDDDDKDDDDDAADDDELVLRGVCVPYDKVIAQDGVATLFQRGSFAKHLASKPDIAIVAHFNLGEILGRTKSGTCTLHEDPLGLQFACLPPATTWGNDLLVSVFRKDVLGAAAAVTPTKQRWQMFGNDRVRIVEEARLVVASVVSFADSGDSIRVTQQSASDLDDDLAAAAHHQQLNDNDRSLLHDMGIEASSTSSRGILVRASKRSRRAALALEQARAASLNAEGLIEYEPLEPKGR